MPVKITLGEIDRISSDMFLIRIEIYHVDIYY